MLSSDGISSASVKRSPLESHGTMLGGLGNPPVTLSTGLGEASVLASYLWCDSLIPSVEDSCFQDRSSHTYIRCLANCCGCLRTQKASVFAFHYAHERRNGAGVNHVHWQRPLWFDVRLQENTTVIMSTDECISRQWDSMNTRRDCAVADRRIWHWEASLLGTVLVDSRAGKDDRA